MPNIFTEVHDKTEELKGKKLASVLVAVVLSFIALGILVDKFTANLLKKDEIPPEEVVIDNTVKQASSYKGSVRYIDPMNYPLDNISYYLEGSDGKSIILLSARDKKLEVAEGFYVEVSAALHQFWGEDTHGAVISGKRLIQLGHHPPDGRRGFHEVDKVPRFGQIKGGLNSGDASPNDEDRAYLLRRR